MDKTRPIILIKKKGGHGGHHGGAWKVAYADFVTAMMALFIVLWLLNTNKKVQESRRRILSRSHRHLQENWNRHGGYRRKLHPHQR
jgi:flagellar motor protein MotB